jgi:hypothetical protein
MKKLVREAVIFILLGAFLAFIGSGAWQLFERHKLYEQRKQKSVIFVGVRGPSDQPVIPNQRIVNPAFLPPEYALTNEDIVLYAGFAGLRGSAGGLAVWVLYMVGRRRNPAKKGTV